MKFKKVKCSQVFEEMFVSSKAQVCTNSLTRKGVRYTFFLGKFRKLKFKIALSGCSGIQLDKLAFLGSQYQVACRSLSGHTI